MTSPRANSKTELRQISTFARRLLVWYDACHRDLPWRTSPAERRNGARPDPYRVWLSEIMLQQTTVEAAKPYYHAFIDRWPDMKALACADIEEVMRAWAGLGYYSRARNLKKCAEIVLRDFGGDLPDDAKALRALPGIGDYTSAAIAAIAFDRKAAVVDGNIERIITRFMAISEPVPAAKKRIRHVVEDLTPHERPGDFAQAMMDLGALICTPKRPDCRHCPVRGGCSGFELGDPEIYPAKTLKPPKPLRRAAAFVAVRDDGAILLRKRPPNGLLGGMTEVPTSGFTARDDGDTSSSAAPFSGAWRKTGTATHVFTHFRLELVTYRCDTSSLPTADGCWWAPAEAIAQEALPTVMRKAIAAAGIEIGPRNARTQMEK